MIFFSKLKSSRVVDEIGKFFMSNRINIEITEGQLDKRCILENIKIEVKGWRQR